MKIEELKIPAPWGFIAVKAWGNPEGNPVIGVHGTGDNAATFDKLIPLLPQNFYYICIDLPGHGFSTSFPDGIPLYFEFLIYPIRVIMDHFQRGASYVLMGHGLGAALCTFVAQVSPDSVSKLILIDATTTCPEHPSKFGKHFKEVVRNAIKAAERKPLVAYSRDSALKKIIVGKREGKLNPETAGILLERMAEKIGEDEYAFRGDDRELRIQYPSFHYEDIKNFLKDMPIKKETIYISCTDNGSRYAEYKDVTWGLLKARRIIVKGDHYCHLTKPEVMAKSIGLFLNDSLAKSKTWNEKFLEPIILVHGFMDNAGGFDNLIPLLPERYYYVCFDLPGHGLSDHFPMGSYLMTLDYLTVFRIVIEYLKSDKCTLIGHSYGGQLSILFAQLFPERVEKLVILDAIAFKPMNLFDSLRIGTDLVLEKWKQENNRNLYSYEKAVEKIIKSRAFGKLDKKSAENLARRVLEKVESDGWVFRTDIRLKERVNPTWELDYVKETHLKFPVKCPMVLIFFSESPFVRIFKLIYDHFKERGFEMHHLEGHHDEHMTNPKLLIPIISEFLTRKYKL